MRDHILFLVNGREHRVAGAAAFTTLANYLRYDAAATGTKIVCEEGDCGACTVLIRRGDGDRKSTRLNSSHLVISYAVFCLKKKKRTTRTLYRETPSINIFL